MHIDPELTSSIKVYLCARVCESNRTFLQSVFVSSVAVFICHIFFLRLVGFSSRDIVPNDKFIAGVHEESRRDLCRTDRKLLECNRN